MDHRGRAVPGAARREGGGLSASETDRRGAGAAEAEARAVTLEVPGSGPVAGLLDVPPTGDPVAVLSLGHGAGAGMEHPFMSGVAARLAARGVAVLRYRFPYMERAAPERGWPPDGADVATATVAAAAERAAELVPGARLFAGGKSFGARMTTTAASRGMLGDGRGGSEGAVSGLVLLGFPLHPAGRPATSKAEHLADTPHPLIFVQGTRDRLADLDLLTPVVRDLGERATLVPVEAADHGFHPTKRSGRTDDEALDEIADAVTLWMTT